MRMIRKAGLLEKRLFRRKIFILVLILLPVMVISLRITAGSGNGVCHIVYFAQDQNNAYVKSIEKKFTGYSDIIDFTRVDSESEARDAVVNKKADAAWIFDKAPEKIIRKAAENGRVQDVVKIYQRTDDVTLKIAREILNDSFFPGEAYYSYIGYVRKEIGITEAQVSDRELSQTFEKHRYDGSLFTMYFPDGSTDEDYSYLMAPVRGMMAVWLLACAFIAVMFAVSDEKNGIYSRVPVSELWHEKLLSEIVLMVNAVVIFFAALVCAGVFTGISVEIISLILYAISALAFAGIVSRLCNGNMVIMCTVMVMVLLCTVVLSPVFVSVDFPQVTWLISANDYLRSIHSPSYLVRLVVYDVVIVACDICVAKSGKFLLH